MTPSTSKIAQLGREVRLGPTPAPLAPHLKKPNKISVPVTRPSGAPPVSVPVTRPSGAPPVSVPVTRPSGAPPTVQVRPQNSVSIPSTVGKLPTLSRALPRLRAYIPSEDVFDLDTKTETLVDIVEDTVEASEAIAAVTSFGSRYGGKLLKHAPRVSSAIQTVGAIPAVNKVTSFAGRGAARLPAAQVALFGVDAGRYLADEDYRQAAVDSIGKGSNNKYFNATAAMQAVERPGSTLSAIGYHAANQLVPSVKAQETAARESGMRAAEARAAFIQGVQSHGLKISDFTDNQGNVDYPSLAVALRQARSFQTPHSRASLASNSVTPTSSDT